MCVCVCLQAFQERVCHCLQKYCLNYSAALQYLDCLKAREDFGCYLKVQSSLTVGPSARGGSLLFTMTSDQVAPQGKGCCMGPGSHEHLPPSHG